MSETTFPAITPAMKQRLAATCEALLALLDEIDGDTDIEETGDKEPVLGWPEWPGRGAEGRLRGESYDREEEDEHGGNVEDQPQHDDGEIDFPGFIWEGKAHEHDLTRCRVGRTRRSV